MLNRKRILPIFIAFALICQTALAAEWSKPDDKEVSTIKSEKTTVLELKSHWYVGGFGGLNIATNGEGTTRETLGVGSSSPADVSSSALLETFGFKVGYEFAPLFHTGDVAWLPAVELEGTYVNNTFDTNAVVPLLGFPGHVTADYTTWSVMLNGLVKAKFEGCWEPYIGLGMGGAWIQRSNTVSHIDTFPIDFQMEDGDDFVLAAQVLLGCDFFLDPASTWSLFAEYKFLVSFDPAFTDELGLAPGIPNEIKYDWLGQHLLTMGLRYRF